MTTSFDWGKFQKLPQEQTALKIENKNPSQQASKSFDWGKFEKFKEDNVLQKIGRYLLQIPAGLANVATWPLGFMQALGEAEALEDLPELLERFPEYINEEKYKRDVQQAGDVFPTQANAERLLEEKLGIPFEPRNKTQKILRLGSEAAGFKPGGSVLKLGAGIAAPTISESLKLAGANEELADLAGLGISQLVKKPKFKAPQTQAKELESQILRNAHEESLGASTPAGLFEESESALNELKAIEQARIDEELANLRKNIPENVKAQPVAPEISPAPQAIVTKPEPVISKLEPVSPKIEPMAQQPKKTGIEPVPKENPIGNLVSENHFHNSTQGGQYIKHAVESADQKIYEGVKNNYELARNLNKQIESSHPELVESLTQRLKDLNRIPSPSSVQKDLIKSVKNIIKSLIVSKKGKIIGYRNINNQTLIDQMKSLRQKIDFDFAHGNASNIFKPIISDIERSVENAARLTSPEAFRALKAANKSYREWNDVFNNDFIRKFRDKTDRDFVKLFDSSANIDNFNNLKRAIGGTKFGDNILKSLSRNIVEDKLDKFFKNPVKADRNAFDKEIRELEAILPENETQRLKSEFERRLRAQEHHIKQSERLKQEEAKRKLQEKAEYREKLLQQREGINKEIIEARELAKQKKLKEKEFKEKEKQILATAKYLNEKPEKIQSLLNTRSGIRELREDLSKSENGKRFFNNITNKKMQSILREGNIEKNFTGNDLYNVLNKEQNFEIFSEIIGQAETEAARQAAKEIGKKQMALENIKDVVKLKLVFNFLKITKNLI